MDPHVGWLSILLLALPALAQTTIRVDDYGAVGDGTIDDGPAVQRAVAATRGQPATITFTAGKTYRLLSPRPDPGETASRAGLSVISLEGVDGLTIDGMGAKLLLHPDVQFSFARGCRNLTLRGFEVDMAPLPFVPGKVVSLDAVGHSVDVRIEDGFGVPVADGSETPQHPPFFGWLVATGDEGNIGHYFVQRLTGTADARTVRLHARSQSFRQFEGRGIVVGTKVSVPVPGTAHVDRRFMQIDSCHDVTVADVRVWSLPYFAFNFSKNTGTVRVTDVTIAPKPGTPRLTSAGRDGFHCKDNRAQMIFERCRLAGLRDDCFNISAMTAVPHERVSDHELVVKRSWYPNLDHAAFAAGDQVALFDEDARTIFWCERVARAEDFAHGNLKLTRLRFGTALPALPAKTLVFNEDVASPGAILRNCAITGSCRMRSRLLIEDSIFTGFNWYTAEHVEGPYPRRVMIRNSHFINRDVRNNRGDCLLFALPRHRTGYHDDIVLQNNVFDGSVVFNNATRVAVVGNQFNVAQRFLIEGVSEGLFLDNTLAGEPLTAQHSKSPLTSSSRDAPSVSLQWPAAIFTGRLQGDNANRHVAALGAGAEAASKHLLQPADPIAVPYYQLVPPRGGEVGLELDLEPRFGRLTFKSPGSLLEPRFRGEVPAPQRFVVYGYHHDGSRTLLPVSVADTGKDWSASVDLTTVPAEFAGRRRVAIVVEHRDAAPNRLAIADLKAWSTP